MNYDFVEGLEDQVGDSIAVIINAGEGCCLHQGILCQVGVDFVTLVDGDERIEVPFESIAAIKKQACGAADERMDP
ncbi:hypothetical protein [Acetohalobium arabaticum]|uniref:Uncharacterized protein n=1 Tax=Acetohalobium arabaticum (strain ATCC 49924 / DSM 5501 / Z-7288) TaxID=574087 RepID=D9QS32_ACEAZ|nr:hypothetical protein [Acetohalobium arabaticum]ADL13323.1 hypothetical protein Acear_1818 [Acetohalobium arabaticum DSM 5501]